MSTPLSFDDPGAGNDEPVKGVTMGDIRAWHDGFRFIADLAEEALLYARVGTGEEVALRHARRKAMENLKT
jgi:hypothetical protein